jgi:hypothetical protein
MLKVDFSDIQKNGFRINQFRLITDMRSSEYKKLMKEYKSSGDLLKEKNLTIQRMTEQNEINFTIYYFSEKLMVLFFIATLLASFYHRINLALPIVLVLLSIILFIIAYRNKVAFVMGNLGIDFARSIYDSEIKEKYNF